MPYSDDEDDASRGRRRRRADSDDEEEEDIYAALDDEDSSTRRRRRRRSGSSDSDDERGGRSYMTNGMSSNDQEPKYEARYDSRNEKRAYYNDNNIRGGGGGGWEGGRGRNENRHQNHHWQDARQRPAPNSQPLPPPNRPLPPPMHAGHMRPHPPQMSPPTYPPPPPPPPPVPPPVPQSSWARANTGPLPRPPQPPQPMNQYQPPPQHQSQHNQPHNNHYGPLNASQDRKDNRYHRGGDRGGDKERSQTCRLTQVSHSITENDIRKHFVNVGVGVVAAISPCDSPDSSDSGQRSLLVQFYSVEESEKAVRCLKAVCDNRFIQVKRCAHNLVDPATLPPPPPLPSSTDPSDVSPSERRNNGKRYQGKGQGKGKGQGGNVMKKTSNEEPVLPEKSGEEQLKEKLQKAKELAAKEAEIKDQRKATLQKQLDETMEMKKRTSAQTPAAMVKMLDDRITKLQGLLSDGLEVTPVVAPPQAPPAPVSQMKIDNRPTTILVGGLPPDCDVDILLGHFSAYGALENVELLQEPPFSALIRFKSRPGAEKAFKLAKSFGGLPLNFSWYTPPSQPPSAQATEATELDGPVVQKAATE